MQQYNWSNTVFQQLARKWDIGNSSTAIYKVDKDSSLVLRAARTKQFPLTMLELSTLL